MSFHPVRSRLQLSLVSVLTLGAILAYAQGSDAETTSPAETGSDAPRALPVSESSADIAAADEAVSETGEVVPEAGEVVSEDVGALSEMTAEEAREAELEAEKAADNASRRARNDAAALEVFQKGLDPVQGI